MLSIFPFSCLLISQLLGHSFSPHSRFLEYLSQSTFEVLSVFPAEEANTRMARHDNWRQDSCRICLQHLKAEPSSGTQASICTALTYSNIFWYLQGINGKPRTFRHGIGALSRAERAWLLSDIASLWSYRLSEGFKYFNGEKLRYHHDFGFCCLFFY